MALYGLPPAGVLALELLHYSQTGVPAPYHLPRSEIIQNLSNLVSAIDFIVRPTNGNFEICNQAKRMLQAVLDTVLSPEHGQTASKSTEPLTITDTSTENALFDQSWLDNNLDMDFWTSLEDHPLLAWADLTENA